MPEDPSRKLGHPLGLWKDGVFLRGAEPPVAR
jgi:hypothetical protein